MQGPRTTEHGGPARVLLAERQREVAHNLALLLGMRGFLVRTAHDQASALEAAQAFLPHAVFIDLGPDGRETAELAKALRRLAALREACLITITDAGSATSSFLGEAPVDFRLVKPEAYRQMISVLQRWHRG